MRRGLVWLACLVAVVIGVSSRAVAQQNGDDAMYTKLNTMIQQHQGKVALYARQLSSGHEIAINADEPVQTASIIKLAILYNAMVDVREGKASWDEKLTLKPGEAWADRGCSTFSIRR